MSRIHISGFKEKATEKQVEELFINKGRIIFSDINSSRGYGYLEYDDEKCAKKAIQELNNTEQFGGTLIVELASNKEDRQRLTHFKRYKQQHSRSRSYSSSRSRSRSHRRTTYRKSYKGQSPRSRREPTTRDKCFVCGKYGHWASQCKEGDGTGVSSGKCFRCGEKGHIARNCPNSRKKSNYSNSKSKSRSSSSSSERSKRRHRRVSHHSSSRSGSSENSSRSKSSRSGSN